MRWTYVILLAFALAACSTDPVETPPAGAADDAGKPAAEAGGNPADGLPRDKLRSEAAQPPKDEGAAISEGQIRQALAARRKLRIPFRLAIYFVPSPSPSGEKQPPNKDSSWRWEEEDRNKFRKIADALKAKALISGYVMLGDGVVEGQSMKAIRLAAAEGGADAVLVVKGAGSARSDPNALAMTYLLVLPALIVPGMDTDTVFAASVSLWDVRRGSLYLSADTDGEARSREADNDINLPDKLRQVKSTVLARLADDIARQIGSMAAN